MRAAIARAGVALCRIPIIVYTVAGLAVWIAGCIEPGTSGADVSAFFAAQWPGILTTIGIAVRAQWQLRRSQAQVAISDEERAQIADTAAERAVHSMARTIDAQRRDLEAAQAIVVEVTRLRAESESRADIDVAAALLRASESDQALRVSVEREAETAKLLARVSARTEALNAELHELRRAIRTAGIHIPEPA